MSCSGVVEGLAQYTEPHHDMVPFLPRAARSVLDVGCATGEFGALLRERRPDLVLWGIEPSPTAADAAMSAGAYDGVVMGLFPDAEGELPGSFDCVFFNDVLEHMVEPERALVAAERIVGPRGVVVASIPNVRSVGVLKQLVIDGDWRYEDHGLLDRTHLRFFTRRSMQRLFTDEGFTVRRVQGINRRTSRKLAPLDRLLGRRLDEFLFEQYVVVATREAA
jgi:SAM-dependent methyltransferase